MQKKKWIPAVVGLGAAAMVVIPFLLINKPESAHPSGSQAPTATAPALPEVTADSGDGANPQEKEMAMLKQHLSNAPAHTPVLLRLAELARESGKTADAVNYLKQAVAAEPSNQDARLELGRALFESGDSEGAIRETKVLLATNPKNVDALYNLGAIFGNLGNVQEARRYWQAAIDAAPASESAAKSRAGLTKLQ